METGHPGGPCARTLYDVLVLLSRPRYSQWQDNERPRGSSHWEERLLGDVAVHPVGVSPVCLSGLPPHYRVIRTPPSKVLQISFSPFSKDVVKRADTLLRPVAWRT